MFVQHGSSRVSPHCLRVEPSILAVLTALQKGWVVPKAALAVAQRMDALHVMQWRAVRPRAVVFCCCFRCCWRHRTHLLAQHCKGKIKHHAEGVRTDQTGTRLFLCWDLGNGHVQVSFCCPFLSCSPKVLKLSFNYRCDP